MGILWKGGNENRSHVYCNITLISKLSWDIIIASLVNARDKKEKLLAIKQDIKHIWSIAKNTRSLLFLSHLSLTSLWRFFFSILTIYTTTATTKRATTKEVEIIAREIALQRLSCVGHNQVDAERWNEKRVEIMLETLSPSGNWTPCKISKYLNCKLRRRVWLLIMIFVWLFFFSISLYTLECIILAT